MPSLLLIEDDPQIAFMYEKKLSKAGFDVRVATDGQQGWQELTEGERPDLLLLDVVLPKKDGFEILKDLRSHPTLHDLNVILLTNLAQEVDRKQGEKLNADDYLVKAHISLEELIDAVNRHLAA